jgi:hypothetical protein
MALMMALLAASALSLLPASLAVTSPYVRPPPRAPLSSLLPDADADGQTPQQVRDAAARPAGAYHPVFSTCVLQFQQAQGSS